MSILNKFNTDGSGLSKLNGKTPKTPEFSQSKLHNTYSINGDPSIKNKPRPSLLDPGDEAIRKYTDNLPR